MKHWQGCPGDDVHDGYCQTCGHSETPRLVACRDRSAKPSRFRSSNPGPGSKLTDAQVFEIRARYAAGSVTQAVLAEDYAVSAATISKIVNRKAYV